jgi:signal transduction histidine kinase
VKKNSDTSGKDSYLKYLEQEKNFSDNMVNHCRSMISIINRDYKYEKVNATFCSAHMEIMDSIVGRSLGDIWGQDTFRDKIKPNIDECFSGKTVRYEASFDTPQDGRRHFEVVFRPISQQSGEIIHLISETFDISDLKRSQEAANLIREEFREFETNLPIGFLRCDPDGNILHSNMAFLRIMECDDEGIIAGRNIKCFYSEKELFDLHYEQLRSERTRNFGRVLLQTFKDREIVCRISGFMAVKDSGIPAFIDIALEDLSREIMLENRLIEAQKLETIGALAGGIAHDFNNILATISGYSELLQEDLPESSASTEKVGKILMAVSKARSLTNQILTFSRQIEQEKVPVNVVDVLDETIGFVKSVIPSNISLKENLLKKNANVFADPTQLFRVFLNLMTNAIQAMEECGGTLTAGINVVGGKQLKRELNKAIVADEYVVITFQDTGIGMEPSLVQRIFEPFYTTREVGKGSGLGLSVVHGIILEMEGEILVSSKKGQGSIFYVYLPVSKVYNYLSKNKGKSKKILFITGNKYESKILSLAIESIGYRLLYASDQIHLEKLLSDSDERPDLIIYMSDSEQINSDDLISIFSKLKIKTPCIFIADKEHELLEEKLVNSNIIKQYLIKPVSLKEIKNVIQLSLK